MIYFFYRHGFLDGSQQTGTVFGHHVVQFISQSREVTPGIEFVVADKVHELFLGTPFVHQLGDEIDTRLHRKHEARLQRTGKTQRLETELFALHLALCITYILLTEILHVMDIETHHVTQSAGEEQSVGTCLGGFCRVSLHQPEILHTLGNLCGSSDMRLTEGHP